MKRGPKPGFRGTEIERFLSKICYLQNGCWIWKGAISSWGYGLFCPQGKRKMVMAIRWAYEHWIGPFPEGLEPDHICRNRACVNPGHAEPVTHQVNVLRGQGVAAHNARKTHCPKGHPYTGKNLRTNAKGHRRCKLCKSESDRKNHERVKGSK